MGAVDFLWVPNMSSPYATWAYSRIRPPSRSRRRTRTFGSAMGGRSRLAGALGRAPGADDERYSARRTHPGPAAGAARWLSASGPGTRAGRW